MTSLNDRHEGRIDPGIFSAQPAFDVGPDGTGHAVEHLVAIAGHFLLDAIVEACPPAEWIGCGQADIIIDRPGIARSEEHTSELQSLMSISYAVLCLQKQKTKT